MHGLDQFKSFLGIVPKDVYRNVMEDINKTRNTASLEQQRFQQSVTSDTARGHRLILLFQADLMP